MDEFEWKLIRRFLSEERTIELKEKWSYIAPNQITEDHPILSVLVGVSVVLYFLTGSPLSDLEKVINSTLSRIVSIWITVAPPEIRSLLDSYPTIRLALSLLAVFITYNLITKGPADFFADVLKTARRYWAPLSIQERIRNGGNIVISAVVAAIGFGAMIFQNLRGPAWEIILNLVSSTIFWVLVASGALAYFMSQLGIF